MKPKIKICGLKTIDEVHSLDKLGVNYAGLWFGIENGQYNLAHEQFYELSLQQVKNLQFVLVTTCQDIKRLSEPLSLGKVNHIQLHGFESPSFIHKLKETYGPSLKVLKTLHLKMAPAWKNGLSSATLGLE